MEAAHRASDTLALGRRVRVGPVGARPWCCTVGTLRRSRARLLRTAVRPGGRTRCSHPPAGGEAHSGRLALLPVAPAPWAGPARVAGRRRLLQPTATGV